MSHHYGQPIPPVQPQVIKRGVPGLIASLLIAGGVLVGCTGGYMMGASGSTPDVARSPLSITAQPSSAASAAAAAEPETSAPEPKSYKPKPSDFTIEVKEIEKSCFGSAGCNITFRIDPKYTGPELSGDNEWTISYKVIGGKDPKVGSFTMDSAYNAQYDKRDILTVPDSSVKLVAKATQVL